MWGSVSCLTVRLYVGLHGAQGNGAGLPHSPHSLHSPLAPACQPWLHVIRHGDFRLVLWGHLPADPNVKITHGEILRNKTVSHSPPAHRRWGFSLAPSFFCFPFFSSPSSLLCLLITTHASLVRYLCSLAVQLPCVAHGLRL